MKLLSIKQAGAETYPELPPIVEITGADLSFMIDTIQNVLSSLMPLILIVGSIMVGVMVVAFIVRTLSGK